MNDKQRKAMFAKAGGKAPAATPPRPAKRAPRTTPLADMQSIAREIRPPQVKDGYWVSDVGQATYDAAVKRHGKKAVDDAMHNYGFTVGDAKQSAKKNAAYLLAAPNVEYPDYQKARLREASTARGLKPTADQLDLMLQAQMLGSQDMMSDDERYQDNMRLEAYARNLEAAARMPGAEGQRSQLHAKAKQARALNTEIKAAMARKDQEYEANKARKAKVGSAQNAAFASRTVRGRRGTMTLPVADATDIHIASQAREMEPSVQKVRYRNKDYVEVRKGIPTLDAAEDVAYGRVKAAYSKSKAIAVKATDGTYTVLEAYA